MNKNISELNDSISQLLKTNQGRRAFLLSVPALLTACASGEKHRYREGDNSGQETSLTVQDEQRMTQEYLPEMKKEYPAFKDPEVQNYISSLGQKIVSANRLQGNPYQYSFQVVDSKMVNAFALPAGTVFVTAPLIKMASTEAELAGVVGHEIGHIQARHTAERIEKEKREKGKTLLYGLGGGLLGGVAGFALGKALCSKQDRECLKRAALYGAAAGAGGGLLIQKFAFMANSREDEMEADRIGFRTAYQAGFDRDHIGQFYTKLLEMEKQYQSNQSSFLAPFTDAMSTHPPGKERVGQMEQMTASVPKKSSSIVSSKDFEKVKKILGG